MARSKQMEQWDHTAALLAKIHNSNCTKKSDLKDPRYFHPYRRHQRRIRSMSREQVRENLHRMTGVKKKHEANGHA